MGEAGRGATFSVIVNHVPKAFVVLLASHPVHQGTARLQQPAER